VKTIPLFDLNSLFINISTRVRVVSFTKLRLCKGRGRIILEYQGNDEVLDMSEASSIRRSQVAAEMRAAPPPAPPQRRIIQGSNAQQPRRRIISPGNRSSEQGPETPPDEEVFAGEPQEGLSMEGDSGEVTMDQEFVPEDETQQQNSEEAAY